jgi:hypothetical protein
MLYYEDTNYSVQYCSELEYWLVADEDTQEAFEPNNNVALNDGAHWEEKEDSAVPTSDRNKKLLQPIWSVQVPGSLSSPTSSSRMPDVFGGPMSQQMLGPCSVHWGDARWHSRRRCHEKSVDENELFLRIQRYWSWWYAFIKLLVTQYPLRGEGGRTSSLRGNRDLVSPLPHFLLARNNH